MNKNDLRFIKTEAAIKQAYISIKRNTSKPLKVSELCEKAMINKTTFYSHYESIEALKKKICKEHISEILQECPHIYDILTDTRRFIQSMFDVFLKEEKMLLRLYENDANALVDDVEEEMLKNYIDREISEKAEFAIRFCVGGAFRLLIRNKNNEERINIIVDLVEKIHCTIVNENLK